MSRKPQPCIECHEAPKWRGKHRCQECWLRHQPVTVQVDAARARLQAAQQPRKARMAASQWPAGRRWCSGCQTMVSLRDVAPGASRCRACNSAASHQAHVTKAYGLTPKQYADLVRLQNGRCAICGGRPRTKRLDTDHDHRSGVVRGLLCTWCNHNLLGGARESVAILAAAIAYLNDPPTSGHWKPPWSTKREASSDDSKAPY